MRRYAQMESLIDAAVARSRVIDSVYLGRGVLTMAGEAAANLTASRDAVIMADEAGFAAAGAPAITALETSGFTVSRIIKPSRPLPHASVEEAAAFCAALRNNHDMLPIALGSGVINDLVRYAAFHTGKRFVSIATAASMDGYASGGAPLAQNGFKITIPTSPPAVILADIDIIAAAPAKMNGWGYGDLAGKIPAGGDWILADLVGAETIDEFAFGLVQDGLRDWLANPRGVRRSDPDTIAELFVGLTLVGFAMEAYGSSRPASGADHQIAHIWEMEGRNSQGQKVAHGAAVAVGTWAVLALYDWLLEQDIENLDIARTLSQSPDLARREGDLHRLFNDHRIGARANTELRAKHISSDLHKERLERIIEGWPQTRDRLRQQLVSAQEMAGMLRATGVPADPGDIGLSLADLIMTVRKAAYIRRRYTILDFLHETGLTEYALHEAFSNYEKRCQ
ncbi:MAG: iron-containing alcohol dehydrogenase [Rhodobacteraceae bacterium]|nr:iron-containing alcohol dehydrogenase [Paracoccaceae bacterium]MCY4327332.1 iron-containing alcohol dehydrogenase [Paracoccaceae bacterium]